MNPTTLHCLIVSMLAVALGLTGEAEGAIGDKSCKAESDAKAIDELRAKVLSERLYSSWAKEQCLSYYPEHCDSDAVEIAIRELHSEECGGDPNTGPVVDRFRIFKRSSNVEWFDPVEAEYVEFDKVHSKRAKARWRPGTGGRH